MLKTNFSKWFKVWIDIFNILLLVLIIIFEKKLTTAGAKISCEKPNIEENKPTILALYPS